MTTAVDIYSFGMCALEVRPGKLGVPHSECLCRADRREHLKISPPVLLLG